jgi:hypothetical protein
MAKEKEFENILNECLDRLIKGETVASCLARYPEHAAELEPLLKTAEEARLAATLQPRAEFRQRAANEFQSAIRNLPSKQPRNAFRWQLRWVIPVAAILVILLGGTGTVVAAANSLPDNPLYGVKLAVESVQMAFTFSEQGKAELYARFIDYRVEEIVKMSEAGKPDQIERATEKMNGQLLAMADLKFNGVTQGEEAAVFGLMMANGETQTTTTAAPVTTVPTVTPAPTTTTTATVPAPVTIAAPPPSAGNETPVTITRPIRESTENVEPEKGSMESSAGPQTDKEKLKLLLIEKFERNLQILRDQLEKAPEAVKPGLLKAIDDLERGYWQAIINLG